MFFLFCLNLDKESEYLMVEDKIILGIDPGTTINGLRHYSFEKQTNDDVEFWYYSTF